VQYINVAFEGLIVKEDDMMQDMFSKLKNLNQAWVIVSRHNGNVFFKRKNYITKVKNYPDNECLWYSELDARNELEKLNATRQKCKYSIENASKYFVNSFEYNRWHGRSIINKAIPIKSIQENKTKVFDGSQIKDQFLKEVQADIKGKHDYIASCHQEIAKLTVELNQLQTINFEEMLKPYETQGDRMVKVLFAAKAKV